VDSGDTLWEYDSDLADWVERTGIYVPSATYTYPYGFLKSRVMMDWTSDAYGWKATGGPGTAVLTSGAPMSVRLLKDYGEGPVAVWVQDVGDTYYANFASDPEATVYNTLSYHWGYYQGSNQYFGVPFFGPGDVTVELTYETWTFGDHVTFSHDAQVFPHEVSVPGTSGETIYNLSDDGAPTEHDCDCGRELATAEYDTGHSDGWDSGPGDETDGIGWYVRASDADIEHCPVHSQLHFVLTEQSTYGGGKAVLLGSEESEEGPTTWPSDSSAHTYNYYGTTSWGSATTGENFNDITSGNAGHGVVYVQWKNGSNADHLYLSDKSLKQVIPAE
jgi:hypothetical protein